MRRNLERTSSEPFLKISTPRAGSQTRLDLTGVEAISGEGGPTDDDRAVSFDADLARTGTDRIDGVRGDNTLYLTGDDAPECRRGVWIGEYFGDITGGVFTSGGEYLRGDIKTRGERTSGGESTADTGRDRRERDGGSAWEERLDLFPVKGVILGEELWVGYSPGCVLGVTCTPLLLWSGTSVCIPRPRYFPL